MNHLLYTAIVVALGMLSVVFLGAGGRRIEGWDFAAGAAFLLIYVTCVVAAFLLPLPVAP